MKRKTLTVKELIEVLSTLRPEAVVVLAHDPEGNGYGPCAGFCEGNYSTKAEFGEEFEAVEDPKAPYNAVSLWPLS